MNPFSVVLQDLSLSLQSQGDGYGYLHFALAISASAFDAAGDTAVLANAYREVLRRWDAAGLLTGFAGQRFRQILEPRISRLAN